MDRRRAVAIKRLAHTILMAISAADETAWTIERAAAVAGPALSADTCHRELKHLEDIGAIIESDPGVGRECRAPAGHRRNRVTAIAFPPISAGRSGYAIEVAARIACRTIVTELAGDTTLSLVRFVLRLPQDARVHWRAFDEALTAYRQSLEKRPVRLITADWRRRR